MSACSTAPPRPAANPWTTGRISVKVDGTAERPSQGLSADFELRGTGDQGELRLLSPIGTRMASAQWSPGRASLNVGNQQSEFPSLDDLSRHAFGEALPLAALPDWLAGRPWPRAPFRALPDGFEQLGWQVRTAERPEGRVDARRESPPAVQLRVRLDPPAS